MTPSLIASLSLIAVVAPAGTFGPIIGQWSCSGHLAASDRHIAALVTAQRDVDTGALIVRHSDAAGGAYKSLEIWTVSADGSGMRASISDAGGMRWFQSPGWQDGRLNWLRTEGAKAVEQFSYVVSDTGEMRIDWSVAREGAFVLGDTLSCRKTRGS